MQIVWPKFRAQTHGQVEIVELPAARGDTTRLASTIAGLVQGGKVLAHNADLFFEACKSVRCPDRLTAWGARPSLQSAVQHSAILAV